MLRTRQRTYRRSRLTELKGAITKAQDHARYAQRELERFDAAGGNAEASGRTRRKLEADLTRAQSDVAVLKHALAEARPTLSHSEAKAFAVGVETGQDA